MKKIKTIGVVGLGYVGLPLALLAEKQGFNVTGVEVNIKKLEMLKSRIPIIDDVIANNQLKKTEINFTDSFTELKNADAVIVCVPTPVDDQKTPDLSLVEKAVVSAAQKMKQGSLLVIESTINPGVCDEVVIPLIEDSTSHKVGHTIFVAHCPERINPGDNKWHVGNINRVLGADSQTGLDLAYDFYTRLIDAKIKKMGSLMEAEACKVVENSFRDINIAFVNELAMSFDKLGINVTNVIDGAATKPFAFMAHYPGIGVGGHCIPVDPYYLIEYAKKKGFNHKFLTLARDINESMPIYAIDTLEKEMIRGAGKSLKNSKVLVLGLSYKPDVADDRESPSYAVIKGLESRGALVTVYDPHMLESSDFQSLSDALANQDATILVTAHSEFSNISPDNLSNMVVFLDGRNKLADLKKALENHKTTYVGLGS